MPAVFLDTGPILALAIRRDTNHDAAVSLFERITLPGWNVVSSDFIIAETFNFIRRKAPHRAILGAAWEVFFGGDRTRALVRPPAKVTGARLDRALGLYRERFEAGLSLTDWTNIVIAQELGVSHIATFAGGFEPYLTPLR